MSKLLKKLSLNLKAKPLFTLVCGLLIVGCGPAAKQSLDKAVYEQKISTNPCAASSACTQAFSDAQAKMLEDGNTKSSEFCDELVKRDDGDLAICEVDIRNEKFQELLASCKPTLTQRLAKISKDRNVGLELQANFAGPLDNGSTVQKMHSEIQVRDTSKGYFAVTGDVQPKQVILTFDDGPEPTNTISVLNTLSKFGVKAHFFEVGIRVLASPKVTQRIAAEGHTIGNHSWNHPNMRKLSFEEAAMQIKKTHSLLHSVLGWVDPFFRFPFGNDTPELNHLLYQNQMASFNWAIDSNDWKMVNADKSLRTNQQVITDVMNELDRRGRGIILMHDIHRRTAELLPTLLSRIAAKGYSTVILQPKDQSLKTNPPILAREHLP